MLNTLSENFLGIYVQLLERPEILKSHLYDVGSYKQGLAWIYEVLFNSFVKDVDNARYRELIALTYWYWKIENLRRESDLELLPIFIKCLRADMTKRVQLEASLRD